MLGNAAFFREQGASWAQNSLNSLNQSPAPDTNCMQQPSVRPKKTTIPKHGTVSARKGSRDQQSSQQLVSSMATASLQVPQLMASQVTIEVGNSPPKSSYIAPTPVSSLTTASTTPSQLGPFNRWDPKHVVGPSKMKSQNTTKPSKTNKDPKQPFFPKRMPTPRSSFLPQVHEAIPICDKMEIDHYGYGSNKNEVDAGEWEEVQSGQEEGKGGGFEGMYEDDIPTAR